MRLTTQQIAARAEVSPKPWEPAKEKGVKTVICRENLFPGWERQESLKKGNVYHRGIQAIAPDPRFRNRPKIKARMDRKPACYSPGMPAVIAVETEPGVHLYILGVAADHTVALFYPNGRMSDQPLP